MNNYVGHNDEYVFYENRPIGFGEPSGYLPYTPNLIIKYPIPSSTAWEGQPIRAMIDHDVYVEGSAYRTAPTKYEDNGAFTSLTGPDSAFRMPANAKPMSCTWESASDIEPAFGVRAMDRMKMAQQFSDPPYDFHYAQISAYDAWYEGWEYITYPRLTAQQNKWQRADLTTWGGNKAPTEVYRFYAPGLTDTTLMWNQCNHSAFRNMYLPDATGGNSAFACDGSGGVSTLGYCRIKELENIYGPKWVPECIPQIFDLKKVKNVNWRPHFRNLITGYGGIYCRGCDIDGLTAVLNQNIGNISAATVNGDIHIVSYDLQYAYRRPFMNCQIGTRKDTTITIGDGPYEAEVAGGSANTDWFSGCTFGPYQVTVKRRW